MKKWEYMIMNLSRERQQIWQGVSSLPYPENLKNLDSSLTDSLNKIGVEGWELVCSVVDKDLNGDAKLIFKRCVE